MDPDFINRLQCPVHRSKLTLLDSDTLEQLNQAISAGQIVNQAGDPVAEMLDSGLINADRSMVYPVIDEIPAMLAERAILMDQLQPEPADNS